MSGRTDQGDSTYDSVRDRFRQWREGNPRRPSPSALGLPEVSDATVRLAATAVAAGLGLFLLALAVTGFVAAGSWARLDRSGATTAYVLVGIFLTIAGVGCILATLNHIFRVLAAPPRHH